MVCDLGKDATIPLESSAIIADDYLINMLVQEHGGGDRKSVDFREELLATKSKNVQNFLHAYLNPCGASAKHDTFPFKHFRKHPTDVLQNMKTNTIHLGESSFKIKPIISLH